MEQILTNPQTVNEWVWFLVSVAFVAIVALGGGGGFALWVTEQVRRAQIETGKLRAEFEGVFNAVAPAGSPQQVYIHDKAVEFTKLDLVKMAEKLLNYDIPDESEARLKVLESAVDEMVLELTDGKAEQAAKLIMEKFKGG